MAEDDRVELMYPGKWPEDQILAKTETTALRVSKTYGEHDGRGWINTLVFGDNLPALKSLVHDPEIKERIRLVYIDPPFATGRTFDPTDDMTRLHRRAYADTLLGSEYLDFLRRRLVFLRELLAADGSIYVHLDQKMAPYVKVLMDEIFGRENFRNWITRKKCHPKGYTKNSYGNIQDFILFYTKSDEYVWNRPLEEITPEKVRTSEYRYVEEATGRLYKKVPIHAPGVRNGATGQTWRGRLPPSGKHWQYPPERLDEFDRQGRIYRSPSGNPRLKIYLDERDGMLVQDIWLEFLDPMNQFTSKTRYPTEKNQALAERIISTSSNSGDIVLDCFVGSGTTLAAAEKQDRRWIGIDNSRAAIEACLQRLLKSGTTAKLLQNPFRLCEAV